MSSSAQPRLQLGPLRGAARRTLSLCTQQMTLWARSRRNVALAASSAALLFCVGAIRSVHRRGRGAGVDSSSGQLRRFGRGRGVPTDQQRGPCPVLWQQIQQRDWLFGLPPQIADAILARLEVEDLKVLRATCRQTYLQVAARTTKLVLALDVSPRTWRLASPRLDCIYPALRELHLILAGERNRPAATDGCTSGGGGAAAAAGLGPGSAALAVVSRNNRNSRGGSAPAPAAGSHGRQLWMLGGSTQAASPVGGDEGGGAGGGWSPPSGPECLRDFATWSANGHLHGLTLLDLSRCTAVPIQRDTWAALVQSLGPGDVTLRVAWRCLLHHGVAAGGGAGGGGGGSGGKGGGGGGGSAAAAAAKAAAAAGALTSPLSYPGGDAVLSPLLPLLPAAPPPRCSCSICGPSPPDAAPVVAALQVLAKLRPCCAVELEGRGLPVRSPALLQQLCGVSQLASVSLAVCGVRPLAHHAGWFSCLRRLHSLELRYREEPGGDVALHQIIRALQAPVPLRSLVLHRAVNHLLDEVDLAALAQLSGLRSLDAPGLRVHVPTAVVMPRLTRLALRSDRLELTQPLVALFPSLEHLELGHGAMDLPPTHVLAAAAAAATGAGGAGRHGALAAGPPPGPGAQAQPWGDEPPQPLLPLAAAPGGALGGAAAGGAAAAAAAGPPELMEMGEAVAPVVAALAEVQAAAAAAAAQGYHHHHQPAHQQYPHPMQLPLELTLHLRLLQGLSGLRVLSIGGKPGHGVEALSSLTALSSLILVRCSEFRPLRKAVEELRGLTQLRSLELHACLGGDACGYEIARLLRRLQKLPNLARLVVQGCDPRLPQQLATAPLGRLGELHLLGLPELQPLDLRYVVQAQTGCRRLVVRGCGRLERGMVEALPAAANRPHLAVEWAP